MTVLQDQMSGGKAVDPESVGFLSSQHASPSPSPLLTEYYRVNNLPEEVTWIYYSLFGFSHASILTAITSAGYHSRLVVLENGPL